MANWKIVSDWLVVSGTIAPPPTRNIPDITAEDTIRIILSNLNLVVPVVAAILVIIIAIIVICILRSKGNHHKGTYKLTNSIGLFLFLPPLHLRSVSLFACDYCCVVAHFVLVNW